MQVHNNSSQKLYNNLFSQKGKAYCIQKASSKTCFETLLSQDAAPTIIMPQDINVVSQHMNTNQVNRGRVRTITENEIEQIGLGSQAQPNSNSAASQANIMLTEEQIKDLQSRYDVTNISGDEQMNLLRELAELGAISGKDFVQGLTRKGDHRIPPVLKREDTRVPETLNRNNILDVLTKMIEDEMWTFDCSEKFFGKGNCSSTVSDSLDAHRRMLSVMEQLKKS